MSATQNENTGKWGRRFMMILFIGAMLGCVFQFTLTRAELEAKHNVALELSRSYQTSHSQSTDQHRRDVQAARREALLRQRDELKGDIQKIKANQPRFQGESRGDVAVRVKHVTLSDGAYWQPFVAPEGGIDTERSLDRAAGALADRIVADTLDRRRRGWEIETIAVHTDRDAEYRRENRSLMRRVAKEVEKLTHLWVFEGAAGDRAQGYKVVDRIHPELGRIVDAMSDDERLKTSVIVDKRMTEMPVIPHNGSQRSELSFLTLRQRTADFAREDALDALSARIKRDIWRLALAGRHMNLQDHDEFMMVLDRKYSRELLVGIGRRSLQPIKIVMGDAKGGGDDVYYQTEVVWSGNHYYMSDIADVIGDTIRTTKRAPFVRLGLSLGLCVLAMLTWLRVDWWLKGHYSLLNKLAFVILAACSIIAVWNYPIHV